MFNNISFTVLLFIAATALLNAQESDSFGFFDDQGQAMEDLDFVPDDYLGDLGIAELKLYFRKPTEPLHKVSIKGGVFIDMKVRFKNNQVLNTGFLDGGSADDFDPGAPVFDPNDMTTVIDTESDGLTANFSIFNAEQVSNGVATFTSIQDSVGSGDEENDMRFGVQFEYQRELAKVNQVKISFGGNFGIFKVNANGRPSYAGTASAITQSFNAFNATVTEVTTFTDPDTMQQVTHVGLDVSGMDPLTFDAQNNTAENPDSAFIGEDDRLLVVNRDDPLNPFIEQTEPGDTLGVLDINSQQIAFVDIPTQVTGKRELNATLATFAFGPELEYSPFDWLFTALEAGAMFTFGHYDYQVSESIVFFNNSGNPLGSTSLNEENESFDFVFGGYVGSAIGVNLGDHVTIFGNYRYILSQDLKGQLGSSREVVLGIDSTHHLQAGISFLW